MKANKKQRKMQKCYQELFAHCFRVDFGKLLANFSEFLLISSQFCQIPVNWIKFKANFGEFKQIWANFSKFKENWDFFGSIFQSLGVSSPKSICSKPIFCLFQAKKNFSFGPKSFFFKSSFKWKKNWFTSIFGEIYFLSREVREK